MILLLKCRRLDVAHRLAAAGDRRLFLLDKLMSKGIYEESTEGRSRVNAAFSELQTLVDPTRRYAMEKRERKCGEHDDAGDDSDQTS
ncbi:MAG TPA: hypothetical protein VFP71_02275 [Candidatus Angelobacter sp.]|nr:hypothetical protein [Candidatus Angelobacter sp.]